MLAHCFLPRSDTGAVVQLGDDPDEDGDGTTLRVDLEWGGAEEDEEGGEEAQQEDFFRGEPGGGDDVTVPALLVCMVCARTYLQPA